MFRKKPKNTLDDIASMQAASILSNTASLTEQVKSYKELSDEEYYIIFTASVALFYILVDRMAFERFDEQTRGDISDLVLFDVVNEISANTSANSDGLFRVINSQIKLLAPYSKRLAPESKDDGMQGVLFWEFAKNLSNDFDLGPDAVFQVSLLALRLGGEQMAETGKLFDSI